VPRTSIDIDKRQRPRHHFQRLALGGNAPAPGNAATQFFGYLNSPSQISTAREFARAKGGRFLLRLDEVAKSGPHDAQQALSSAIDG